MRSSIALQPGQSFEQTLQLRAPVTTGRTWLIVSTDPDGSISEILEDNNTQVSATPVEVRAAYHATVQTDITTTPAVTPIPLSGQAYRVGNGPPVPHVLVNIHVGLRGTRRILSALTDDAGRYTATFTPLLTEAGSYTLGADHPGLTETAVQDEFSIVGFQAQPALVEVKLIEQSSATGAVSLVNLGELPLTGLNATAASQPAGLGVTLDLEDGDTLPGSTNSALGFTITADSGSQPGGTVVARVTSAEGASAEIPFYVTVQPRRAQLVAAPTSLFAGMVRGRQAMLFVDVANLGGATSGPVTVSLPPIPWLGVASTNPLPALAPGETNRITLLLTPPADLPLGMHRGTLVLSGGNASLALPFEFRALSEARGDLRITAVDEFTYYAQGAPRVTNFTVRVTDSLTGNLVTNGVAGAGAEMLFHDLPESYYDLEVQAEGHGSSRLTFFLAAGRTNDVQTFLPRQAARYTWTVEPTLVEDRTKLVLKTTFESFVPMPVVTVEPTSLDLATLTQEVSQVEFKISNHGLIAAEAAQFLVQDHPLWEITPLAEMLGQIPAQSTLTVPVTLRRLPPPGAGGPLKGARATANSPRTVNPCNLGASIAYQLICGIYFNSYQSPIALYNAADCGSKIPVPDLPLPPAPGPGDPSPLVLQPTPLAVPLVWQTLTNLNSPFFRAIGSGGGTNLPQYVPPALPGLIMANLCDPCVFEYVAAGASCLLSALPGASNLLSCIKDAYGCAKKPGTLSCMSAVVSCAKAAGKEFSLLGKAIKVAKCGDGLMSACGNKGWNLIGRSKSAKGAGPRVSAAPPPTGSTPAGLGMVATQYQRLEAYVGFYQTYYGDDAWFEPGDETNTDTWLAAFDARVAETSFEGIRVSDTERGELLALPYPAALTTTNVHKFIDRWNRTLDYEAAGIFSVTDVPPGQSIDFIARDVFTNSVTAAYEAVTANEAEGITDPLAGFQMAVAQLNAELDRGGGGGVCGKISLQLDQSAVVSRDAFRATLEVVNESGIPLELFSAALQILTEDGQPADDLFGLRPPELQNLAAVDGSGQVSAGTTARVTWTLVPTVEAAPDQPRQFYVSGVLSYKQDAVAVAMPLSSVPITVHPTPRLSVKYFHERDVFSDDPFTDVVEPTVPFNLAVLVENHGQGVAKNMRISSGQPQIVENEKGLLVDFKIIATEVEGRNLSPSLTVNFGDITNGQRAIGRWLLTASLQGLFTDYAASFEHLDSLGNPKLSLFEDVIIHEMIHLVDAGGAFADGRPDFLVNDAPDPRDLPDTLYLSDGTTNAVTAVEEASVDHPPALGNLVVQLTTPLPSGWVYLRVADSGTNLFRLTRVVRSDGREISLRTNAWTTDRTFIGLGKRPVYENLLHLLDHDSTGDYTLHYAVPPAPDTNAPSSVVAALPGDSPTLFQVRWAGEDSEGHAIASYDIYISTNGRPFVPWLQGTTLQGATCVGGVGVQYAFYSIATDEAGNRELPPGVPDATTVVTITNQPPAFDPLEDQVIDEGTTLQLTVPAHDPDGPGSTLTYSLGAGAPPGALLNPATGRITWTTGEGAGPSTNLFVVGVRDSGFPALSVTSLVTVIVREVNARPSLASIAGRIVNEGVLLSFTNRATDPDLPANTLRFSLRPDAPNGAAVDESTGVFRWRPTEIQGPSTNLLAIVVSDNGSPSLSATQEFSVIVRDVLSDFALSLGSTNILTGESNAVPVVLTSGLELSGLTVLLEYPQDRLTNLALFPASTEVLASVLRPAGPNQCELEFFLDTLHTQPGRRVLARLGFESASNQPSAIVPLKVAQILGTRVGGAIVPNAAAFGGRIIVVGAEPVLCIEHGTPPPLTLYGKPGASYAVEWGANLTSDVQWTQFTSLQLEGRCALVPVGNWPHPLAFFRARELGSSGAMLAVRQADLPTVSLLIRGEAGAPCLIQTTTNLGDPGSWVPAFDLILTNTIQSLDWTNATEPGRFFRALSPR